MTKPTKTIYLVWCRRGDYSDRTEYAVCWYPDEATAKKHAENLTAESNEWRGRACGASDSWAIAEKARLALGDSQWSHGDESEYYAVALELGPAVKP